MSKFSDCVELALTGKYFAVPPKMKDFNVTVKKGFNSLVQAQEYSVEAGFKVKTYITHSAHYSENFVEVVEEEMKLQIKKIFIEEIFGEFRPIIAEMQKSIYQMDQKVLGELLGKLSDQMFKV